MSQVYKVAVGNVVQVNVKMVIRDGAADRQFKFTLTANRKTQEEIEQMRDLTVKDFLLDNVTDWSGQRLVVLENNEPAAFSREAFEVMLAQPGVLNVVWLSYQRDCASKEKN
ncbi:hypothetical protein LHU53_15565 [Rhodoferax sp. U2-2l]|uniref:hypothetical protein n=1 Tax=Rhodoferax sp. U2-2l TaxID=2884000 RepID=UPI001D0A8754|nr:hypothetical protein [Rhodoferax sp. U2-2l]MCB8748318.1 hypothetical protein [Rhodoferax sp. U2-2l]